MAAEVLTVEAAKRRAAQIRRAIEDVCAAVSAGRVNPADGERARDRLRAKLDDAERELGEAVAAEADKPPTVVLDRSQLVMYWLVQARDDARGRALAERGELVSEETY